MDAQTPALRAALAAAARRVHDLAHTWRQAGRYEDCTYDECRKVRSLLDVTQKEQEVIGDG